MSPGELPIRDKSKKNFLLDGAMAIGFAAILIYGISLYKNQSPEDSITIQEDTYEPVIKFGFDLDQFHLEEITLQPDQFLGNILDNNGINYRTISELEHKSKEVYSVRKPVSYTHLTLPTKRIV